MKTARNENYAAYVVEITNIVPLENRDNIVHTNIFGNMVITSKDTKVGDIGLYFPVECALSSSFCSHNNLYAKKELNKDDVKGYIGSNGRVRAIRLGGHISNGLFIPLQSLSYLKSVPKLEVGDYFDKLSGEEICRKYVVINSKSNGNGERRGKKAKSISKVVNGQFRLHYDTTHLGRNLHMFAEDNFISITDKVHGTSGISSKVLTKPQLTFIDRILKLFGVSKDSYYDGYGLYASRRVVKNERYTSMKGDWYKEEVDFRKVAHEYLIDHLKNGMTFYYEIIGYLPSGAFIQKPFDYGYALPEGKEYRVGKNFGIKIYRITYTSLDGDVYEFSAKQVQSFCKEHGLEAVREVYYGTVKNFCNNVENLIPTIEDRFFHTQCPHCSNPVPNEGVVVKNEDVLDGCAYKHKNFDFIELETRKNDNNEEDIEANQAGESDDY